MKFEIQAKDIAQSPGFDCGAVACMDVFERPDHLAFDRKGHYLDRGALEELANEVDLLDFLGREIAHRSAAVGPPAHDAHQLELGQHLADDMPLDVEAREQLVLDQTFTWPQEPERDLFLEPLNDVGEAQDFRCVRGFAWGHGGIANLGRTG